MSNLFGLDGDYTPEQIGEIELRATQRSKSSANIYVYQQSSGRHLPVLTGAGWWKARGKVREMIKRGIDWVDIWCDTTPTGKRAPLNGPENGTMWGKCLKHLFITAREADVLNEIKEQYAVDGDAEIALILVRQIIDTEARGRPARERLIIAGETLYGDQWQTNLAHDLNLSSARRVREWVSGERSIPIGVWSDIIKLLRAKSEATENLANDLEKNEQ